METPQTFTAGGETFVHPNAATDAQRRDATATLHERFARAAEKVGGISATRDAPAARRMAQRLREQS